MPADLHETIHIEGIAGGAYFMQISSKEVLYRTKLIFRNE
jgi:hypothetical protein